MDATVLAYIAGFLDGDGSIFFQIVQKKGYVIGFQIRSSLAFYQKSDHQEILHWLKDQLQAGYIRHRKTGISDYTIVAPQEVVRVLKLIQPYARLKKEHVNLGLEIVERLSQVRNTSDFFKVCQLVDRFGEINYSKKRTITASVVEKFFNQHKLHAPVETDPKGESRV